MKQDDDEIKIDSKISETAKKYLKMEHVYLDTLDGYRFESLCARIFRGHGFEVIETSYSNDEGRDLILKKDGKTIFVECKHHQNSIGRPVIQKLDSAIRMGKADKGIVITTSTFSNEAIKYAEKLNPPIELKDFYALIDLAEQVGIEISHTMGKTHILCYGVSHFSEIQKNMNAFFDQFRSSPMKGTDVMNITSNKLELHPKFLVTYDINADFSTSVGNIHSIYENDQKIMIDAISSTVESQLLLNFLKNSTLSYVSDIQKYEYSITRNQFNVNQTSLMEIIGNTIAKKYTANVNYTGRNNQRYSKICTPHGKDIRIKNIQQVFLPMHQIFMTAVSQEYRCSLYENNASIYFQKSDLFTCRICKKEIKGEKLLCNDCGKVSHTPTFFSSHSFLCKKCGKTICKDCNSSIRYFLFFKKNLCKTCANEPSKIQHEISIIKKSEVNLNSVHKNKSLVKFDESEKNTEQPRWHPDHKKERIAILMSVLCGLFGLQGIGHIYSNRVLKGITILIAGMMLSILFVLILSNELNDLNNINSGSILLAIMFFGGPFWGLYAYQIYDIQKWYRQRKSV